MSDSMNEMQQIQLAQQGDTHALAQLLHDHYSFLLKYLIKITMQPELAQDLAQDTMVRSMEKLHLYNGQSKFSTWLITIASRMYIDHLRKGTRERQWRQELIHSMRKLRWQSDSAGQQWPDVLDALAELSPDLRLPVIMRHYYGYTQDEIAEMLDIPSGTVKSRIHNGLKRLRKEMDRE